MAKRQDEPGDIDGVSVIGFRLNPDSETADVYTLMTYGAEEAPVVADGQILFFRSPASANAAYEYFSEDIRKLAPPPSEVDAVCDIAAALYVLNHQEADESATILNCLNTLFDLVKATRLDMPVSYKKTLYAFADHLTFNREFASYISRQNLEPVDITNAILWCVGAVTISSRMLEA